MSLRGRRVIAPEVRQHPSRRCRHWSPVMSHDSSGPFKLVDQKSRFFEKSKKFENAERQTRLLLQMESPGEYFLAWAKMSKNLSYRETRNMKSHGDHRFHEKFKFLKIPHLFFFGVKLCENCLNSTSFY